jgi:hypothetical protein
MYIYLFGRRSAVAKNPVALSLFELAKSVLRGLNGSVKILEDPLEPCINVLNPSRAVFWYALLAELYSMIGKSFDLIPNEAIPWPRLT